MAMSYASMRQLIRDKQSIDARLRACERTIARYKLQLTGAHAEKQRLWGVGAQQYMKPDALG